MTQNRSRDRAPSSSSGEIKFERDEVSIVETNVDDVTGEVLGATLERLFGEGALDATATSCLGKKGRVCHTIRVVCKPELAERFATILVRETGTLGVKTTKYERLIVPRKIIDMPVVIGSFHGNVSVKVARSGDFLRIKPEIEDARKISKSEDMPLREVLKRISIVARERIGSGRSDWNSER